MSMFPDGNIPDLRGQWQKHFAILPVKINGDRYWFKSIYRRQRYVNGIDWGWEYGTILDVIKTVENNNIGESQAWGG